MLRRASFQLQAWVLFTLIYISSEISMAACPEALFLIVCRPSCPSDPSWHFSEDFRPRLAWEERAEDENFWRGSQQRLNSNQRPPNSASRSPFPRWSSWGAGLAPGGAEGIWAVARGPASQLGQLHPMWTKGQGTWEAAASLHSGFLSSYASGKIRNSSK